MMVCTHWLMWPLKLSERARNYSCSQSIGIRVIYQIMDTTVCNSLEEVRSNIDRIDRQMVALIAERGKFVKQAARFKKNSDEVQAPQRVEQVIVKVRSLATEAGADAAIAEQVWRVMIAAFVKAELAEHAVSGDSAK